jgi:cystathionine beta-lyase
MPSPFDEHIERRGTGSIKWEMHPSDVIPMWVADMDFRSPEPVIQALQERVAHGIFGYQITSAKLAEVICERMRRLYGWAVLPEHIVFIPGLVTGTNMACRAVGAPGDGVVIQTPAYPPFVTAPAGNGMQMQAAPLSFHTEGSLLKCEIDFAAFEAAFTPQTRLFLMSNPLNPAGVDYTPAQLTRLAEICLRHNVVICSDEIHCDLLLDGQRHTPTASLAPEIADRCITLMAPSKTFNIAGLGCSFAIITNPHLREKFAKNSEGTVPFVNALGYTAALAAYQHGEPWLAELLPYLTANRDVLVSFITERLPQFHLTRPDSTYLSWMDCRPADLPGDPYEFFLQEAKVAFSDGKAFGPGGEGHVRVNFGCPRAQLLEALERMQAAVERVSAAPAIPPPAPLS